MVCKSLVCRCRHFTGPVRRSPGFSCFRSSPVSVLIAEADASRTIHLSVLTAEADASRAIRQLPADKDSQKKEHLIVFVRRPPCPSGCLLRTSVATHCDLGRCFFRVWTSFRPRLNMQTNPKHTTATAKSTNPHGKKRDPLHCHDHTISAKIDTKLLQNNFFQKQKGITDVQEWETTQNV